MATLVIHRSWRARTATRTERGAKVGCFALAGQTRLGRAVEAGVIAEFRAAVRAGARKSHVVLRAGRRPARAPDSLRIYVTDKRQYTDCLKEVGGQPIAPSWASIFRRMALLQVADLLEEGALSRSKDWPVIPT